MKIEKLIHLRPSWQFFFFFCMCTIPTIKNAFNKQKSWDWVKHFVFGHFPFCLYVADLNRKNKRKNKIFKIIFQNFIYCPYNIRDNDDGCFFFLLLLLLEDANLSIVNLLNLPRRPEKSIARLFNKICFMLLYVCKQKKKL